MSDLIGQIVGPYQITERLGRGGMAEVYKAFHKDLEVYRAIKFIRPELGLSEDFRTRFLKEAQGVARLQHPNIVGIHDFGASEDRYYMVMEMIEGRSLKDILKKDGQMSIDRSVALVKSIASALAYAHDQGLIHRDIKPDNIMVDARGRPVLMDFGIAKLITSDAKITQTGHLIGTPAYMAPEQSKALDVGPPTDIYALSVVLFEMLTGHTPFEADTPMAVVLKSLSDPMPMPRSFNVKISEELQGVILKGTAKDMKDRYQSAMEFSAALDRAMDRIQATMDKTLVLPPAKPDVVPGSSRVALVVVLAVLLLGSGIVAWLYLKPGTQDSVDTDRSLAVVTQSEPGSRSPETKPGNDKTSDTKKEDFPRTEDSSPRAVTEPDIEVTKTLTPSSTSAVDTRAVDSAVPTQPIPIVATPDPEKERLAEAARAEEDARVRAEADARARTELVAEQKQKEEARLKAAQAAAASETKNLVPRAKPAMVSIAGGSFSMGCGAPDTACLDAEKPVHTVTVKSFRLSKHEVTFDQYDAFAIATGRAKPDDKGWGRGNRPVINVNWEDANAFVTWLAKQTGEPYRLPTEAEWEYAARGQTSSGSYPRYSWGNQASHAKANYGTDECCDGLAEGPDQ